MLFLLAFTGGLEGWEGRFEKCLCTYKNLPDLHRSICLKRLKEWGGHPGAPFVFPDEDKWGRMEHRAGSTPRALVPHLQSCPRGSGGDRRECGTMRTCVGGGGVPCSTVREMMRKIRLKNRDRNVNENSYDLTP